jgi:hypothetical protein
MFNTDINTLFSARNILHALDKISDSEAKAIGLIPFGSVEDVFSLVTKKKGANRNVEKIKEKPNQVLYNLEKYDRTTGELKFSGKFIIYKVPNYLFSYLVITFEDSEFFHQELRPFIKSFYSEVILSFFKSKDLIRLIENYQSSNGINEVKITRASQKIRYHDESSMSTVTWNNSSLEDAYQWLRENNGFFKSIQFKAFKFELEVSNVFIDRRGILRVERNFSKVYESLVIPNFKIIDHYIKLFNKRGRRDNDLLTARPLEINFGQEIFEDKSNHGQFIQMLSSLEDLSVSVMHGNPYIHLSILDYIDGSTCDIWVVDSKQLLIVPQLHSSIISLKRIVNHIFDNYAEGEILNHE